MIVRPPSDWGDIVEMVVLAKKMHGEGHFSDLDFDIDKVEEIGTQLLVSDRYFSVLCEQDGVVIGMMVCYMTEFYFGRDFVAQDMVLYVEHTRRGGLAGWRMIEKYVEWATAKGCKRIQLGQTVDVDPALVERLYTKAGFKLIGQLYERRA